jgi:hypothetical protein
VEPAVPVVQAELVVRAALEAPAERAAQAAR